MVSGIIGVTNRHSASVRGLVIFRAGDVIGPALVDPIRGGL